MTIEGNKANVAAAQPMAPPATPRAVTAVVARRAWGEPHVRFWWTGGVVVLGIFAWFCAARVQEWVRTRNLIRNGTVVQAKVLEAGGLNLDVQKAPKDALVKLQYEVNGQEHEVEGALEGREDVIVPQSKVPIRVDPAEPEVWTYRTEVPAFGSQLSAGLTLLPVGAGAMAMAWVMRKRVLRTWERSPAKLAVVVSAGQSAIAPGRKALRCAFPDERNKRVYTVFVPGKMKVGKGDVVWVMQPFGGKGPAVAGVGWE